MDEPTWPAEWQRGFLELIVLSAIDASDGPTYGYRIVQAIEGAGFSKLKGGTLYPILGRLETAGLLATRWGDGEGGPGRKFIQLTEAGRAHLARLAQEWERFAIAIANLTHAQGERTR